MPEYNQYLVCQMGIYAHTVLFPGAIANRSPEKISTYEADNSPQPTGQLNL
jgi:hypothetical protein